MTDSTDLPDPSRRPGRRELESQAYASTRPTEAGPVTNAGNAVRPVEVASGAADRVSSRTTDEEARDLVALRRARRGDDQAFANLLRDNDATIRAFVAALVGHEWCDRASKETYVHAYRGLPLTGAGAPRIWLLGIADGACRDTLRRWERTGNLDRPTVPPPIPIALPADERLVLGAVEAAGLTVREAGRLVPGGVDQARELLERARRHVADELPLPPAPAHDPDFWNELGRLLILERTSPATSMDEARGGSSGEGPSPQAGRAARGMAQRVAERSPRVVPWRRIGLAAAVVATIGALIVAVLSLAHRATQRDIALGDTATKVLVKVDQSLARDNYVSGTAVVSRSRIDGLPDGRYAIARSNTGSYRTRSLAGALDEGYDSTTGTFTSVRGGQEGEAWARSGTAPGPPEWSGSTPATVGDLLAESLRIVHRGSSGTVESTMVTLPTPTTGRGTTTTVPGRPVWVLTAAQSGRKRPQGTAAMVQPGTGVVAAAPIDEVRLVVDRSLVLPSRLELLRRGAVVLDVRFTGLSIGQQSPDGAFVPTVPSSARVQRADDGFDPKPVGDVVATGGRASRTPSYLPDGYVLTATAVNTPKGTVVLTYRNGSLQLTITSRPARRSDPEADPFGSTGSDATRPRSVRIGSGAFAGAPAWTSTMPVDHVWAVGSRTEVIIAGDPPLESLKKVLASLQ